MTTTDLRFCLIAVAAIVISSGASAVAAGEVIYDRDYPFIHYSDEPLHNDIARLQKRLDDGSVTLTPTAGHGYLEAVLQALNINPDSQTLVFSKTSLQIDFISPASPRAVYFNDDTYVAWLQKSDLLEVVTMDADRGPVFYLLHAADGRPVVAREALRCLVCHDSYSELGGGVPRFLFESTYDVRGGMLIPDAAARPTGDETPISERWGGWYVTGWDGGAQHLGNILPPGTSSPIELEKVRRGSVASLDALLDTSAYLRRTSDIVALLILEHQVSVHNQIIRANYKSRMLMNRELPAGDAAAVPWAQLPPKLQTRLDPLLQPLVDALALANMAPLSKPVAASNGYADWFQTQGPHDARGRSLRQLELHSHVFRYPLSYLIYSEGFDALPLAVREHVYVKLAPVLKTTPDGQAAFEILMATKPAFAHAMASLTDTPTSPRPDH